MIYRIKDWRKNFETAKTVEYNHCQRITFTNNLNKIKRKRLLKHKDGPGHLAVWFSICQYHSAQSKPREGYLTDSGQQNGEPLDALDLADLIGMPRKLVSDALQRLANSKIAWLDEIPVEVVSSAPMVADQSPDSRPLTPLHSTPLHLNSTPLSVVHAEWFEKFWTKEIWGDLRGRTKAMDVFLKIKHLDEQLFDKICKGAVAYQEVRLELLRNNGTPKMAQGWLNDRRWEDDPPPRRELNLYVEE